MNLSDKIKATVRDVPDFPKPGILFKDIVPLFSDPELCQEMVAGFAEQFKQMKIEGIACIESRGFFLGMMIAQKLQVPFIPLRKKGKLPYETVSVKYDLEYGSETLEMHVDSVKPGQHILIHDDLLATGGTALAASQLIQNAGGKIAAFAFIIELGFLKGKEKLLAVNENVIALAEY